jgi:hypothetical protein
MHELFNSFVKFLVIIIIGLGFNKICNDTASKYYQQRIESSKTRPKVYDISHLLLPDINKHSYVSEIMNIIILLPFVVYWNEKAISDFISYLGVILLIRSLVINLTILPKDKNCDEKEISFGGCYDKIFSGHFSTGFLATLIFYKYNMINSIPILASLNIINAIIILAVRNHYTIDLVVSIFVVLTVFNKNLKF